MGFFDGFLGRKRWRWPPGKSVRPPEAVLSAMASALRRGGKIGSEAEAVAVHLALLLDPAANPVGAEAVCNALASPIVLTAMAAAADLDVRPSDATVIAAATMAGQIGSSSAAAAAAVAASGLLHSLLANLEGLHAGSGARAAVMAAVRQLAPYRAVRESLEEVNGVMTLVATLRSAVSAAPQQQAQQGAEANADREVLELGAEAAWALEMLAGVSRRMCTQIGQEGGAEAALRLLHAARAQQARLGPAAVAAAANALHTLLALVTENRRNRRRLRDAGGAAALAEAFADPRLGWEAAREQAAGLLEDLAATLAVDEGQVPAAPAPAVGAVAMEADSSLETGAEQQMVAQQPAQQRQQQQWLAEWRTRVLPAVVGVLRAKRGSHLQESKEAAAAVLAKFARGGEAYASMTAAAGAVPPLLGLLQAGVTLAGGERRAALAALAALHAMVPGNRDALLLAALPASVSSDGRQPGLLDLLLLLMDDAASAAAAAAEDGPVFGGGTGLAAGLSFSTADIAYGASAGPCQVVRAGWAAASLAAALCTGHHAAQDQAAAKGLLPALAAYLQADAPAAAGSLGMGGLGGTPSPREEVLAVQSELASCLRSFCLRSVHHAAVRASGVVPRLHQLASADAPVWPALRAAARQALQALGEVEEAPDRPLLAYTPAQLASLLRSHGIDAERFLQRGVTGAEFVRLSDAELRSLAAAAQLPRLLRLLRAWEAFAEIGAAGSSWDGSLSLAKLVDHLSARGFRQAEVLPLAEGLMQLMDGDRDNAVTFPDFLPCFDEYAARTLAEEQPASKRRKTTSTLV